MRRSFYVTLIGLLLAAIGMHVGYCARGADKESDSPQLQAPAWHFQRLLVPADRPEDWPREKNQRYLPVPAEEFEQRIAQLRKPADPSAETPTARLASAEYTATLAGNNLIDGEAVWQFETSGKDTAVVVLDGCELPLADSRWIESPQHAVIGNDQYGRLAVVVPRAGKLRSNWSLRGRTDSAENLTFDLQLPACPISSLHLTLPADVIALVDHGLASPDGQPQHGEQRWKIELGGNHRALLQIVKRNALEADRPLTLVQSSQLLEFSPRGLELSAEFRMSVTGGPLRRLTILFDQPLSPVKAQLGDIDLPITLAKNDGHGPVEGEIEFPEALADSDHVLHITAVAPITTGERWQLPVVHLPQTRWQEGTATLRVAAPLVLDDLLCTGCRQTKAEPMAGPAGGENIGVQWFSDLPRMDLLISRRKEEIRVASGISISLRGNDCAARCVAEFTSLEGERFTLEAEVAPQWIIDNVEGDSPGRIVDWSHEALLGKPGKLKLQLSTPLSPQHKLRLVINGRRRRAPLSERLRIGDLEMLTFTDVESTRRLIHLQASDPYQLQFTGADALHYLELAQLAPAEAALLEENAAGLVFVDDQHARGLSVSLSTRPPRFQAEIHAEAVVHDDTLTEAYRFSIVPQGREMARVIVRFSQPRTEPIAWSIDGDESAALRARRLSEAEQAAFGLVEGEAWEVTLLTPRSTAFEIRAARQLPLQSETPVALAALVNAESQHGDVRIRSTGSVLPELRSRRLTTLPVELPTTGQQATLLASFRYDPEEDTLLVAEPPLVLAPRGDLSAANPAWIWQAHLTSCYQRGGAEHVLTCRVENTGRAQIEFRLPVGAQLRGAWVDNQPAANTLADSSQRCTVTLPSGARFVSVMLQWTDESDTGGRTISSCVAPWPECDVPVLARQWTVSLPIGFVVEDAQTGGKSAMRLSWIARLFGPLARGSEGAANDSPFSSSAAAQEAHVGESGANQQSHKPTGLLAPWKPTGRISPPGPAGWTTYQFDDSAGMPGKIWVADQHSLTAWAWAVFVLVAGIGLWLGRWTLALSVVGVAIVTAVALIVPVELAHLTAAGWLGIIAGQLLALFWRAAPVPQVVDAGASESTSKTKRFAAAATGICLWAMLARLNDAQAEEPTNAPGAPRPSEIRQVLVPVDHDLHPTGGLYYLPESFHEELLKATADVKLTTPQYLITQAMYRAEVSHDTASGELNSDDWRATFEIESLAEHATVRFPLDSQCAALVPDGVKLDDKANLFHWDEKQKLLTVELAGTGQHHLEVMLRPQHRHGGFDFPIPAAAGAQLEMTNSGSAAIEVESALGAPVSTPAKESRTAKSKQVVDWLGPSQRIVARPLDSASSATSANAPTFEVDELYWLHVRRGSVMINGRYRIKVHEGQVQRLHVLADSHLLALPVLGGHTVKEGRVSNESKMLTIDLPHPVTGEATIDVEFLLDGATGVGEMHLPRLQVDGAASARRWWGATIDPALDFTETPAAGVESLAPAQFIDSWGASDAKPQFALDRTAGKADWILTTRPHETKLTARYRLAMELAEESVGIRLATNVAAQGGPAFEYRLSIPASLQIEDVSAYDQNGLRPAHWARSGDNLLTVMLDTPATGDIKLLLRGRMPRSNETKFTLPEFRVQGSESEKFRAIVYRNSEVQVAVLDSAGLKVAPQAEDAAAVAEAQHDGLLEATRPGEEQLAAVLDGPQEFQGAVLQIERNRPRMQSTQATAISRNADAWQAAVELHLQVEDGVVDVLRFELPAEWSGPFKITPAMPYSIEEMPGLSRRQLVLFPETPLSGTTHLHIVGPLTVAAGQRPSAPDVHLVGAPRSSQYFLLPRRIEDQQLSWDTRVLIPKPLPEELAALVPDAGAYRSYQLMGARYRAVLRSAERSTEDPQVRLADISTTCQADGRCWGVAGFDLEPAGATNCVLEMPAGYQVVNAQLDGTIAQRTPQGENRWNIWLGDNKLPRRLEIIFTGPLPPVLGAAQPLEAPTLVDLPVERTLWSVSAPQTFGVGVPSEGSSVSEMRHELLRYEATTALADSAAGLLLEESSDDLLHWYAPWGRRFLDSRTNLQRLQAAGAEDASTANATEEIAAIEQDQARLARRLGTSNIMSQMSGERTIAADPQRLWALAQTPERKLSFAMTRGSTDPLLVSYPERQTDDRWLRFAVAGTILLLAGAIALAWSRRRNNFDFSLERMPYGLQALGMLAGLVWWLWLTPSFVGMLIMAASIYAIGREIWPGRRNAPMADRG